MARSARKINPVETKIVAIRTTPQTWRELDRLVQTGLFGKNPSEVADQLVREKLRELLLQGWPKPTKRSRRGGVR